MKKGSCLSIFVDESGDFGFKEGSSKKYVLSFIFHDQTKSIESNCGKINDLPPLHAGPLIRKEPPFENIEIKERKAIWRKFSLFFEQLPIKCSYLVYDKKEFEEQINKMEKRMNKDLFSLLESKNEYLRSFDQITIYYDRGQAPITKLLAKSFADAGINFSFKEEVKPYNYRLFQAADYVSTVKLIENKMQHKELSESEKRFVKPRDFKKTCLNPIAKKRL